MISLNNPSIKRETEKAVLVSVRYFSGKAVKADRENSLDVWFPKSQIEVDGADVFVSDWILGQKSDEMKNKIDGFRGFWTDSTPEEKAKGVHCVLFF